MAYLNKIIADATETLRATAETAEQWAEVCAIEARIIAEATLSPSQTKWAASHDWFVGVRPDGLIVVRDWYTIDGVLFEADIVWTKSFRALRDWAGY